MHSVSRLTLSAAILTLTGLAACGDKIELIQGPGVDTTRTQAPRDSSVQLVTVTPNQAQIALIPNATAANQAKQTFVASVSGGANLTNRNVTWSSSNTAVATVDAQGVATAVGPGQTTIIATSAANTSVRGAATLLVTPTQPASLSFFQVQNSAGNPATLNNAGGQLNVIANVDPGQSGLTQLQLLLICPRAANPAQSDTTVVSTANVAGSTGSQTAQQVTLPFNTAAFNATTGAASFRNGTCALSTRGLTASGATVISATGPTLTLNNTDVVAGTISGARTAQDEQGLRWDGGAVTVTVLPVFYSGQTPATLTVTLNGTDTDGGGTGSYTANAVAGANGAFTATFTEGTTAALTGTAIGMHTFPNLTATVGGVSLAGQPIVDQLGNQFTVFTTASAQQGTTGTAGSTAFIRYDNEDPTNPTFTIAAQNPNFSGGTGFINGAFQFPTTGTAGAGFGALGAAGCTFAAGALATGTNGTLCDHDGVDRVTFNYAFTTAAAPTLSSAFTAITTAGALDETSAGNANALRVNSCDALGNCAGLITGERFGVDRTAPSATVTTAPTNNQGATTPAGLSGGGNIAISAVDSTATGQGNGSGFSATPVSVTLIRRIASGASGQTTQCVNVVTGATSAVPAAGCASQQVAFNYTLPTTVIDDAAEYTLSQTVTDLAGNAAVIAPRTFQVDAEAPIVGGGGISIPANVTAGTSFSTTATDSTDLSTSAGAMEFQALGFRFVQQATASPTGTIGDNVLTRTSTITYTASPFYGQIQQFTGANTSSAADDLDQIRLRARDIMGNTSVDQLLAIPDANVTTGTAFSTTANNIQSFGVTSSNANVFNGGSTPAGRSTTTNLTATINVGTSTGASPFTQVCFYYQSNGGSSQGGAVAGEYVLIGCQGAAAVTQDAALNRIFTYTVSGFDPAGSFGGTATIPVIAVGTNGTNAALISTAGSVNVAP